MALVMSPLERPLMPAAPDSKSMDSEELTEDTDDQGSTVANKENGDVEMPGGGGTWLPAHNLPSFDWSMSTLKSPPPLHWSAEPLELPCDLIGSLDHDIVAAHTGPEEGIKLFEKVPYRNGHIPHLLHALDWSASSRKAYGATRSLYDTHPLSKKQSGDPVADAFSVVSRRNSAVLVCADGVNWGEKSMLAARTAVYAATLYLQNAFYNAPPPRNTQVAISVLKQSIMVAHEAILKHGGGLTTLCVTAVLPLHVKRRYAVCCVNVGDSLAYVYSRRWGLREITLGSHDIQSERNLRDALGAIGPANGTDPELANLTCSLTHADPGDLVFLTSDGVSDNFDPVVCKVARARRHSLKELAEEAKLNSREKRPPDMEPFERHIYSCKQMERILHEVELETTEPPSARDLCHALMTHVVETTAEKRGILENPIYYKRMKSRERKQYNSEITSMMSKAPGKLDHATVVAYEVGLYNGEQYQNDDVLDCEKLAPLASIAEIETCL